MTRIEGPMYDVDLTAKELEGRLAMLQGISIFFPLPDPDVRRLARKLNRRTVPAGTELIRQDVVADRVYLIVKGRCEVRATWPPNHAVTVALLAAGDFFGISAMDDATPQPASVTALETTELLELLTIDIDDVLATDESARAEMEKLAHQRRATVELIVHRASSMGSHREGQIIAVYSVKGGAGKTTLAVNMAAAISDEHRGECVLLDLGLPYNHAALTANLVPTGCLALLERVPEEELEERLLSACSHHPIGMMVLPGSLRVEQSELITPQLVRRALTTLTGAFTYVVVDLGVSMSEMTLTVLEMASQIVLIVTPELTAMKDTRELLDVFGTVLNIPDGTITMVLNRPRPSTMVERADVERTVGRQVDLELDHDGIRCDRAAVTGELLVVGAPTSALAKKVKTLAESVAEGHEKAAKPERKARAAR